MLCDSDAIAMRYRWDTDAIQMRYDYDAIAYGVHVRYICDSTRA